MSQHLWTLDKPLDDDRDANQWETLGLEMVDQLKRDLEERGLTPAAAPPLMNSSSLHGVMVEGPFRILCGYVVRAPDRPGPHFRVRVDTLVEEP